MPLNLFTDDRYLTMIPIIISRTTRFIIKTRAKGASDDIRLVLTSIHPAQIMILDWLPPDSLPISLRTL